jgi:hypothetical protein
MTFIWWTCTYDVYLIHVYYDVYLIHVYIWRLFDTCTYDFIWYTCIHDIWWTCTYDVYLIHVYVWRLFDTRVGMTFNWYTCRYDVYLKIFKGAYFLRISFLIISFLVSSLLSATYKRLLHWDKINPSKSHCWISTPLEWTFLLLQNLDVLVIGLLVSSDIIYAKYKERRAYFW